MHPEHEVSRPYLRQRRVELRGNFVRAANGERKHELRVSKLRRLRQRGHICSEEVTRFAQPSGVPFDHVVKMLLRMRPRLVIGASDITEMELRCREIFWIATGFPQSVVICVLRCRIRKAHEMASHPSCSFDRFWRAGTDPQRWM